MSATVWAWALHSLKRIAQSMESTGNGSSEAVIASTALLSCFRVTMWVRGKSAILPRAFAKKLTGILQSGEKMWSGERFLDQFPATVSEDQQMPGEIPAVHRGNILGIERMEIACVIPVVEMSAEQFHLSHGRQGGFKALDRFQRAQPSKISRANGGKKIEANICRRSSMRDHGIGRLLKIVRGERVVFLGNECFEIAPSPTRNEAESLSVGRRQRTCAGRQRLTADPERYRRRRNPENEERSRSGPSAVVPQTR